MPRNKHSITGCRLLRAFDPQHSFFPSPHTLHQGAVQVQLATSHLQNQGHLKGESEAKHLALPITAYNNFGSFGLWARIFSSEHVQTFQMTLTSKHQKSYKSPNNMQHHWQWNPPWPFQYPESIPTPVMCRSEDSSSNSCQQSIIPSYQFEI